MAVRFRTSDFYLSLFIGHLSLVICCLTENPWQVAKDFGFSSTDLCASVFIGGFT